MADRTLYRIQVWRAQPGTEGVWHIVTADKFVSDKTPDELRADVEQLAASSKIVPTPAEAR